MTLGAEKAARVSSKASTQIAWRILLSYTTTSIAINPAAWRLASFEGIYQRDHMRSVNPAEPLPVDWELVKTLRPSYRFLAYTQLRRGYKVNPELLGDDRPDLLEAFYAQERRWLETGR